MLTNRLGLPKAIVHAVTNDPYTRGESDISVTQLITPPFQRKLRQEVEVVEDVADRIWSLVGQIGHTIVERAYPQAYSEAAAQLSPSDAYVQFGVVAERRLFMPVNGWTVSGQFDVIEDIDGSACLQDFKFTTVYSVMGDEPKQEWVEQLNFLRLLALHERIPIDRLRIIAVLRDWQKAKSKNAGYPSQQVVVVEIPVWPVADAEAKMLERVKAHQDLNPPVCTDEERWKKGDVFAVMKNGRKTAVKLHETKAAAHDHAEQLGPEHTVVRRDGEFTRCMSYCNVAHACPLMRTEF